MNRALALFAGAFLCLALLPASALAQQATPTSEDTKARLEQLETEVRALRQQLQQQAAVPAQPVAGTLPTSPAPTASSTLSAPPASPASPATKPPALSAGERVLRNCLCTEADVSFTRTLVTGVQP